LITSAETLRLEFDAAFAAPPRAVETDLEELLAIFVGERPYALRVSELGGTAVGQRVTPVPSSQRALLGLCGLRGVIVPVYDLASLLGEPRVHQAARWLALSSGENPVAFAFTELEGHLRVSQSELEKYVGSEQPLTGEVVRSEAGLRPILRVAAAVDFVRRGAGESVR
jgi:chemotaxis signal transduction protein